MSTLGSVKKNLARRGPPFQGELMRCALCGMEHRSQPNRADGWRALDVDARRRSYACAACVPAAEAPPQVWQKFYLCFVSRAIGDRKPAKRLLIWRETAGGLTQEKLG